MEERPKRTKEEWERLARMMEVPEEKIQKVWEEVLEYRRQQELKAGNSAHPEREETQEG